MSSLAVHPDLAAVETLFRALSTELSVQRLAKIVHENARLRDENEALVKANTGTTISVHRLLGDLNSVTAQLKEKETELKRLGQEKRGIDAELTATKTKTLASVKTAADLEAKFKKQEGEIKDQLKVKSDELERVNEFSTDLKLVDDNEKEM